MHEISKTNLLSSLLRGVSGVTPPVAKSAICPITVWSPMFMTIPLPYPSLTRVPKKAKFLVSRGLSLFVHSTVRSCASTSPVSDELSTFISLLWMILISAGIFSPILISKISPTTSLIAGISLLYPSLMTVEVAGRKFLNPAISASDLAPY